ncbi:MAG: hypothetical protein Q4G45_11935 [Actinomycetia bacterium]|nr:hypothetical protein [Actinomycetes bacterium]
MSRSSSRDWLVTLATSLVVAAVMVVWFSWLYARSTPRFEQLPPGEAAQTPSLELRVVSISQSDTYFNGGKVVEAGAGVRAVQAVAEVLPLTDQVVCSRLWLIGSQGRRWAPVRYLDCSRLAVGEARQVVLLYVLPERDLATVSGLAEVPGRQLRRAQVVSPAARP